VGDIEFTPHLSHYKFGGNEGRVVSIKFRYSTAPWLFTQIHNARKRNTQNQNYQGYLKTPRLPRSSRMMPADIKSIKIFRLRVKFTSISKDISIMAIVGIDIIIIPITPPTPFSPLNKVNIITYIEIKTIVLKINKNLLILRKIFFSIDLLFTELDSTARFLSICSGVILGSIIIVFLFILILYIMYHIK
jgi:hypothetical protein